MRDPRSRGPSRDGSVWAWLVVFAIAAGSASGQTPDPASPAPTPDPDAAAPAEPDEAENRGEAQPLSLRYRFTERYATTADPKHPAWLTQYQVGVREKVKVVREKPEGAPDRAETTLQTIYTERVMGVTPTRTATDVVRRYDRANLATTLPIRRSFKNPEFLEQLSIWYRIKPGRAVELFNLIDGRELRQMEFDRIVENPFLPQLATMLPTVPRRVGDRWPVSRANVAQMLGETPLEDEFDVQAELAEVRAATPGASSLTAVLAIQGTLLFMEGPVALNVRVHFSFDPPAQPAAPPQEPAAGEAKPRPGVVEAEGWISEIRMTQVLTAPVAGDETGRLNQTQTRELVLARRVRASELGTEASLPLVVRNAPIEDEAHSWVTYDDPDGRFHLSHSQNLRIARVYPEGGVDLVDRRPDGQDVISVVLATKTGDDARDRLLVDPSTQRKALVEQWRAQGQEVRMGDSGWLKEEIWGPLDRKVYRLEAALIPQGAQSVRGNRIYLDRYIVQFKRAATLIVTAMTTRDPHVPFRDQTESLIKSFTFGPSEGPVPAAPAQEPASAPAP